jgi:hypothetical protein
MNIWIWECNNYYCIEFNSFYHSVSPFQLYLCSIFIEILIGTQRFNEHGLNSSPISFKNRRNLCRPTAVSQTFGRMGTYPKSRRISLHDVWWTFALGQRLEPHWWLSMAMYKLHQPLENETTNLRSQSWFADRHVFSKV